MSKKRQSKRRDEVRNLIISTARSIVKKDGVEGLSIRKIAKEIDYSPSIVYHYFKDKKEIVQTLVSEGYKQILDSVRKAKRNEDEPEEDIKEMFKIYIETALNFTEEYKAFILNDDPEVLKITSILTKGISKTSPTMKLLTETIQRGIDMGRFIPGNAELMAQIVWTSVFGFVLKLMYEKNVPNEQKDLLVEQFFKTILNGTVSRKEKK